MLPEHKTICSLFTAFLSWGMLASFAHADSAYSAAPAQDDPLAFYTPDAHFKPTTLPDWVWDRPLQGYADNEAHIEAAAKAGVQIIYSSSAAVYYPLRRDDPKSGLKPEQDTALKGQVARAKSHDMKIVIAGQASVTNLSHLIRLHPEWAMHPTDDPAFEEKLKQDPLLATRGFCLNSPWGEHYRECLAEVMKEYKIDGYTFDGNYINGVCYCPSCKKGYKKDTGRDLPKSADYNSIDFRIYKYWAEQQQENWHRKLSERLREINPEAGLLSWTVNAGRHMSMVHPQHEMSQRMNLLLDCPTMEWWLDEYHRGGTILSAFAPAYLWAVSGYRVAGAQPYCMSRGNPYDQTSFPPEELMAEGMLALTNGIHCPLFFGYFTDASTKLMKEMGRRAKWTVRAEPMTYAGLLFSDNTRTYYGVDRIEDRFLPHIYGFFRAATEGHLALNPIIEWDLRPEQLAKFRVLILPNAACLSDPQVQAIRDYVKAGGGLVATGESSRYDLLGRERGNFALADVFGVDYVGALKGNDQRAGLDMNFAVGVGEEYWKERGNIGSLSWGRAEIADKSLTDDPRLRELVPNSSPTFKGPMLKVSAPKVPMQLAAQVAVDGSTETLPGIVTGTYGKGRVVYMSAAVDHAYYSYSYPYQRLLLNRAVQWAAGEKFPITVKAPMCIQSTFMRQSDKAGKRIIVHLFNEIASTSNHSMPYMDVPHREETVPVGGIQIQFTGLKIKSYHWEPDGVQLTPQADGYVSIPALELHGMLVAELED